MVKITLEFEGVDQAIVALAKLVGGKAARAASAPPAVAGAVGDPLPAEKPARQPRADKGQSRGKYKPRGTEANPGGAGAQPEQGSGAEPAPTAAASAAAPAAAAPGEASVSSTAPGTSSSLTAVAGVSGGASDAAAGNNVAARGSSDKSTEAGAVPSADDTQKALNDLFEKKGLETSREVLARFGVQRLRDLPAGQRAEFIKKIDAVLKGEAV